MTGINKGERVCGSPAQHDTNPPDQKEAQAYGDGTYETNAGRGIYSATTWVKATRYASPFALMNRAKVTAAIVILVRIPGSLESVGMCMQVGPPPNKKKLAASTLHGWTEDRIGQQLDAR